MLNIKYKSLKSKVTHLNFVVVRLKSQFQVRQKLVELLHVFFNNIE